MQSGTNNLLLVLKALSDPVRMRILEALPGSQEEDGAWNVSQLADHLNAPQPTVSHHLGILRNAGLVGFRKSCRDVYYWMDREMFESVLEGLREQFKKP
ncbi:MAG: winged helix-turn-helix transcriptional regulator [Candidatus Omnitrophica bacterium]|nr:winged helix-turn-helix transcriptional regulator [Candidatus Omnitrophota bacterium]